jgi:hypothetical protein
VIGAPKKRQQLPPSLLASRLPLLLSSPETVGLPLLFINPSLSLHLSLPLQPPRQKHPKRCKAAQHTPHGLHTSAAMACAGALGLALLCAMAACAAEVHHGPSCHHHASDPDQEVERVRRRAAHHPGQALVSAQWKLDEISRAHDATRYILAPAASLTTCLCDCVFSRCNMIGRSEKKKLMWTLVV